MHSCPGKLVELLTIDGESMDSFIGVRLTFDQMIDLRWSLDQETAYQINQAAKAAGSYRYRLSLRSFWNASQQSYYSHLTRSYQDQSETVCFPCSEAYVRQLQSVKKIESLLDLPALSSFLSSLNNPAPAMEKDRIQMTISPRKRSQRDLIRTSTVIVGAFIALLSNSPHYFQNRENVFANVPPVSAAVQTAPVSVSASTPEPTALAAPSPAPSLSPSIKPISRQVKMPAAVPSDPAAVPAVMLNKLVNFTLPATAVALTFDDGPSKYTKDIVDTLKKNQVGGTFFFVGVNVEKFPDAVKYVHANGYSIGDHSMTHSKFTKLSPTQQELEINQAREIIEQLTSQPVTLFRPPYGAKNKSTLDILETLHMRMVLWNRDTEDWKTKSAEATLKYVKDSKAPGAIILLHESKETLEALPEIISYLKNQDIQIVNLR